MYVGMYVCYVKLYTKPQTKAGASTVGASGRLNINTHTPHSDSEDQGSMSVLCCKPKNNLINFWHLNRLTIKHTQMHDKVKHTHNPLHTHAHTEKST